MYQLPTKKGVARMYTVAASKPKHRPLVRLQNATRTKFKSKTNSEQIATA
jgi:hypothetical protein